jgi:hypothetical protein
VGDSWRRFPTAAPLTARDRLRYVRLLAALRLRRLPFPHPGVLHDPRRLLTRAGLADVTDQRRRFAYPLAETDDALRWVRSLYRPGVAPRRIRAAQRVARGGSARASAYRSVASSASAPAEPGAGNTARSEMRQAATSRRASTMPRGNVGVGVQDPGPRPVVDRRMRLAEDVRHHDRGLIRGQVGERALAGDVAAHHRREDQRVAHPAPTKHRTGK